MVSHRVLTALAFALAASAAYAASPGGELPAAADLLSAKPLVGTWTSVGDGATTGYRFTTKQVADTVTIGCNEGTAKTFVNWQMNDTTQNGDLSIYTAAKTETFAATATNDGKTHILGFEVDGKDSRLAILKPSQKSFAVHAHGQSLVLPWDKNIAAKITECAQ